MARTANEQQELDSLVALVRNDARRVFHNELYPDGLPVVVIALATARIAALKALGGTPV